MKLFIDDIRVPSDVGLKNEEWTIVRTYDQATTMISYFIIDEISFDHDLADFSDVDQKELTGYDVAKFMVDRDQEIVDRGKRSIDFQKIQKHFKFNVHSANPVGKKNIESLLNNYIKHKFGE